jgi:hypothetical protein
MFLRSNLPAFAWASVIFALCSMPGKSIPHISWLELLSFDKFVHASIFFVQQVLLMRGLNVQTRFVFLKKNSGFVSLLLSVAYGGLLELMQSYCFIDRSGDALDFTANSIGCITGLLLFKKLQTRFPFFTS